MRRLFLSTAVLLSGAVHAEWLTLFGSAGDGASDYVQTEPTTVQVDGQIRFLDIRVNRAEVRTSTDGVHFRSFEGKAEVDCDQRTARYVAATFFSEPNFSGTPVASLRFQKNQNRPLVFRKIPGALDERLVKAACALKANSP